MEIDWDWWSTGLFLYDDDVVVLSHKPSIKKFGQNQVSN